MKRFRLERWEALSGIVFVALFTVGLSISSGPGDTDQKILAYYADSGKRARDIALFFLVVVGGLFLLWFLGALRSRLRRVEAEPRKLSALAFGAGVASTVLLIAAVSIFSSVSAEVEFEDQFRVDPNTARLVGTAGFGLFVASIMVASVLVAATSVLAVRTAVLPRWLGWIGFPAALALLVAIFFFPVFVLLAWILVVSVAMLARPGVPERPETAVAGAA